jgi:hypothetical protein
VVVAVVARTVVRTEVDLETGAVEFVRQGSEREPIGE